MNESLCIVPIRNFVIESVFKLNDVYFSPLDTEEVSFTDTMTKEEFDEVQSYVCLFNKSNKTKMINSTIAIMRFDNLDFKNVQEAFTLVDRVCEKLDRILDYFRLSNCHIGNFDTLPGIPGFLSEGFKTIYKWDNISNSFEVVPGEVTTMFQKGIGLMLYNEPTSKNYMDLSYKCLFSDRQDEVFLNCRSALTRVNEAMYMNNLNAAFVYLMTTIEMLADKDNQLNFSKVRPKILPFVTKTKKQYHNQSEYIRELSRNKRTEIVHNGKNIYELYDNKTQVTRELFRMTALIVNYVETVVGLEIYTFYELEEKRNEMKAQLGI